MNIFAEQLVDVLHKHDHELSNLFTWKFDIPPSLVVRLKASLTTEQSATLNRDQLDFIADKYDLDEDDLRRLRAALLAETIRKMIASRMAASLAYKLGMVTLDLLLSDDPTTVMQACDLLVTEMRDLPTRPMGGGAVRGLAPDGTGDLVERVFGGAARDVGEGVTLDVGILLALDGATEAFQQGQFWLEIARDTADRRARAGYAAHAHLLFTRAAEQGQQCPPLAQGSDEQIRLLHDIQQAQADATNLSAH